MAVNSNALVPTESAWVDRLFSQAAFSPEYQDLKFTLHRKLLDRINLEMLSSVAVDRVRSEVRSAVARLVEEEKTPLSMMEKDRIIGEVLDEVFGLGPLEPLLADPTISDILVTTPKLVYIERAGKLYKTPVQFKDNQHLMRIIEKIVARVGRRVDESSPLVDARLPDGSRVNAAIPPVAVDGPLLSIRRFGRDPLKAEDLVRILTLTDGMMELCKACVKARLNILISGGTGAGKTTLLNVFSSFIPEDERIVTIEDAAELKLRQEHVARMETRPPNIEGTGAISLYVFMLATFVGLEIIRKVSPLLHTPLMSITNAISGICVVGAIMVTGAEGATLFGRILGFIAVTASVINIVSGFLITDRMLKMFKKREDKK